MLGIAIGATACVMLLPQRVGAVLVTPPPEHVVERVVEQVPVMLEPPAPPPLTDVNLVFTVGDQTFVDLESEDLDLPKHAAPELVTDGAYTVAVAEVSPKHLPSRLRSKQRSVIVDGTCEAHFASFAIVARVSGNARDASSDLTDWDAASVMEYGRPFLAGRIEGCTGTFARDAALPGITLLTDTNAPGDLAERAMASFIKTDAMKTTQEAWIAADREGNWYEDSEAHVDTHVFRHPRTGVMWVVIHAFRYYDCGEAGGDVVGFYRVEEDGKLTEEKVRGGSMSQLDHVIDLEGDGEPELVGTSAWDASIERMTGESVTALGVSSFGCGC